ncbi:MAG: PTS transporter subunit EIIC [Youngiibacter sp.]|nr:PTS transporter subunit EIIC [Youngiibacter sp.]
MNFINEKFLPFAEKLAANKFLRAVSTGFMMLMPVIIIGSMFSLFNSLAIPSYQAFLVESGLKRFLAIPNMVTNDILALYAVFFISYTMAGELEKDSAVSGMLALMTFLAITPITTTGKLVGSFLNGNKIALPQGVSLPGGNVIPYEFIGAKGLFVAIIVGLATAVIYSKVLDKGIMIKMPDSVPPTVSKSFAGLLPGFVIIIIFLALDFIIGSIGFQGSTGIHTFVYKLVQAPLEVFLGANIFSFLFAIFLAQVLWFFGLHGVNAVLIPIFFPLWTSLTTANLEALNAGVSVYDLPNIIGRPFFSVYASAGGSGVTLGLCIYMAFLARSKQLKTLGKLALPAGVAAINEPLIFGLPIVLNPYLAVPFIAAPLVTSAIGYALTVIGFLPKLSTLIPLGTPILMSGFLASPVGGLKVAAVQILLVVVSGLIYLPFIREVDKQALALELEEAE